MADSNVLPTFVTVISFLGVVVLLIGWIPTEFYPSEADNREMPVPDEFDVSDVEFYNTTWSQYLNNSGTEHQYGRYTWGEYWQLEVGGGSFGGWDIDWGYSKANKSHHNFYSVHRHTEYWGILAADHQQDFTFEGMDRGEFITDVEIQSDKGTGDFAKYRVNCDHFTYYVFLGFNSTLYNNATDAWNHNGLLGVATIGFDDMNTGVNAWSIISALLWFSLPDTHWMINAVIAIPIYACIAYLSFIVIMRVVEALPFT